MATKSGRRAYIPDRGDAVWLTFDPQAGHEQAGVRPAIVLSPLTYNERSSLILVVPVTRQIKGYPFEVVLPAGLPISGAVLSDQIKSVDWHARDARFIGKLPEAVMRAILLRANLLLAPTS
ncbi:MAG TPA: endoribonuclease MazF [Thermoanaerobaculia bacterium]|nr:endoribonuclease MazF [Thermoanaerobaculia bacterium]